MGILEDEILAVLRSAATGKSDPPTPWFLTAYQILERLPTQRDMLIAAHGDPGKGAQTHYSAASAVQMAIRRLGGQVITSYIDSGDLKLEVAGRTFAAGYPVTAIYRIA